MIMTLHADKAANDRLVAYKTNKCPQCDASLLAPEWSEFLNEHRVRHTWSCEECGYAFETDVFFAAAA
jgi:ribosomal protein S27AE